MNKISPSILAADFSKLSDEIKRVQKADMLHFDVMDGHFVKNISFGIPVLESVRNITDMFLDVHLMITHPYDYIDAFSKAGADLICFHVEATIKRIKDNNVKAAISIKPNTPVSEIKPYIHMLDMVLVMSVEPGFGGQSFMENSIEKIKQVKDLALQLNESLDIEVDGGINTENAKLVTAAGANVLVAGSAIFNSEKPNEDIETLRNI